MFTFQWPYFIIMLPGPLFIYFFWPARKVTPLTSTPEIRFPHLARLRAAYGQSQLSPGKKRHQLLSWLLFLAWSLFVVALMQPQIIDQLSQVNNEGHDLMLAVDLSGSMQSLDFSTDDKSVSRLDVAKHVVEDFVSKRAGDRIGLVLFGQHAYLNAPLTLDRASVSHMLNNSLPGMAGDSTAIGDAIGLAVKNLRERPAQSRAIILLTDGDDNASTIPPLEAANLAKQYGIKIYTIVIGKEGIVPFPDEHGGIIMVQSQVDTTLTSKIAEITGGEFYRATDEEALAKIYDRIDSLEKSKGDAQTILIRKPLFQYPIAIALVIIGVLGLLAQIRRDFYELWPI